MPIETGIDQRLPQETSIGAAYLAECRHTLLESLKKIEHCLDQLPDAELQWRPFASQNSIQNVILHLCGNLRQWIVHGTGNAADHRVRAAEFADREPRPKAELLDALRAAVEDSIRAMRAFPEARLLEPRRIQGFETTVLSALFDSTSHFVGHTHQIVYITRLRLGEAYRFQWTPASSEQGA